MILPRFHLLLTRVNKLVRPASRDERLERAWRNGGDRGADRLKMRACRLTVRAVAAAVLCVSLPACTTKAPEVASVEPPGLGVPASPKVVAEGQPVPKGGGRYQIGKAYQVAGKWYEPKEDRRYDRVGVASWYGSDFHGRLTANGEVFDRTALMAAHPTMPLPSYVRVTNLGNNSSVVVRVNDRGPYSRTRLIDVSEATADLLGFKRNGMAVVRVQYVGKARLDGNDTPYLMASYCAKDGSAQPAPGVMLASAELPPHRHGRTAPVFLAARTAPTVAGSDNSSATAVAYAGPPTPNASSRVAGAATKALTASFSADDRIFMAFQTVSVGR